MIHPTEPLSYADAIGHVEGFLLTALAAEFSPNVEVKVYDYFDGDETKLAKRPWVGVRISEVSFHVRGVGGSSYMQVDQPWGIAFCGQVERCILALIENWNASGQEETDQEFERLQFLIDACTCIDWTQAAHELKMDYTSSEIDGETHYWRE